MNQLKLKTNLVERANAEIQLKTSVLKQLNEEKHQVLDRAREATVVAQSKHAQSIKNPILLEHYLNYTII